jgi:ribosomal protein S20
MRPYAAHCVRRATKETLSMATIKGTKKQARIPGTMSIIDVGWRKGVFHRNTAARYKSRMAKQAQAVISGKGA